MTDKQQELLSESWKQVNRMKKKPIAPPTPEELAQQRKDIETVFPSEQTKKPQLRG